MYGSFAVSIVLLIQRDVTYFVLFQIVCNINCNTEDRHSKIRLSTVNKVINEREHYKDFIVNLPVIKNAEDSKYVLFRYGENG